LEAHLPISAGSREANRSTLGGRYEEECGLAGSHEDASGTSSEALQARRLDLLVPRGVGGRERKIGGGRRGNNRRSVGLEKE